MTSSRKSRKRLPRHQVDEPGNDTNEDSLNAENSSDFNGNEDREHNTVRRKRAPRKSKIRVCENEKPVQKGKRTKKAPDESTEEPTKKKFSHSTRRNRRHGKYSFWVSKIMTYAICMFILLISFIFCSGQVFA